MSDKKLTYWRGYGDYNFQWKGRYTHGYSSTSSTRVWLTEIAGTRYEASFMGWSIQEHEKMNNNYALTIYGRDQHCMRGHSPTKCLDWLRFVIYDTILQEMKQLENTGYPAPKYINKTKQSQFCIENGWGHLVWYVIHQLDAVKAELVEVERIGTSQGVIFDWY